MTLAPNIWTASTSASLAGGGRFGGSCLFSPYNTASSGLSTQYMPTIYGDLTVEFWTYYTPYRTQGTSNWNGIFGYWSGQATAGNVVFMYSTTQTICACGGKEIFPSGSTTRWTDGLATGWHHVAIVRLGQTWTCYIDGTAQLVSSTADTNTVSLLQGSYAIHNDGTYYSGTRFTSDVRISNLARYTANFTPPTAPFDLSTDPNASTVMSQISCSQTYDNFDATYRSIWNNMGSVSLDTSTYKFGSQSLLFSGTSTGYARTAISPDLYVTQATPWTVDLWVNAKAPMCGSFVGFEYNSASYMPFEIGMSSNGQLSTNANGYVIGLAGYNGGTAAFTYITDGVTALTPNTWNHIEAGFDGTTAYLFLNGTLVASGAWTQQLMTWNNASACHLLMGRRWDTSQTGPYFQGWMQELCITKGVCRHTASFTAPTAPYDLSTDPYASNIVMLVHGTQLPTNTTPIIAADALPVYAGNFTSVQLSTLPSIYQTGKTFTVVQALNDNDISPTQIGRGNVRYVQDTTDTRTNVQVQTDPDSSGGFINGICVVQGNPLNHVFMEVARNDDYNIICRTATDEDGTFTFHDLQIDVEEGFYLVGANPDAEVLNENAQVYKALDATPYAITLNGSFTYETGTTTVDSTVTIAGNYTPFTVSVVAGSLPPDASVSVNGRSISITGASALDGDYIFSLQVTGSIRNYSTVVQFELTPSGVTPMSSNTSYDGSIMWVEDQSNLLVSMDFANFASTSPFSATIPGLTSWSTSSSPALSQTQYHVGNASLYLNGSNQYIWSNTTFTYPTGPFTIELWVFMTALKNNNIFTAGQSHAGFQLGCNSTGQIYFWNGTSSTIVSPANTLAANTWYHVALTRDMNGNCNVWVNGTSVYTIVYTGVVNVNGTTDQIRIGHDSGSYYLGGYVNNLRIWNTCIYSSAFTPSTVPFAPNLIMPLYP